MLSALIVFAGPVYNTSGIGRVSQAVAVWLVMLVAPFIKVANKQFRMASSNYQQAAYEWTMVGMGIVGMLSAGHEEDEFATIDFLQETRITSTLITLNSIAGVVVLGVLLWAFVTKERWPINQVDVFELLMANSDMIATLNAGKRLLESAENTPADFFPRKQVFEAIETVRLQLEIALVGSAYFYALSSTLEHSLCPSLPPF